MYFLRQRQFWTGVGAFVAAAAAVAAYAIPPWPSPLNWAVDALAFLVMFVGGLVLISQFVLPVQTMAERRAVFDHLVHYLSGSSGPIIFVKDGRLVGRKSELKRYGRGVALVDPVSAIVLERAAAERWWFGPGGAGPALVRAAGPGIVFIEPGERIVATLDLRRQSRGELAQALTRDGLEVTAYVSVSFGLDPNPDRQAAAETLSPAERVERNLPAYPFNPTSGFRAVYGMALADRQPVEWTDLPITVAVECFRDKMAEHSLDELFQPSKPGVFPFDEFQGRVATAVKEAPVLRERGILVYSASVGNLKLPREVVNQRVRSWQARWRKATIQQVAAGETQIIRTEGRWRAQAQQVILKDFQALLGATSDQLEKRALALMLAKALQRAAAEPNTRKLLPREALHTLDSMQEWLK